MSTAEPSFVPWRAQVFFIEHPLSVSFVFRYAKAWQSYSLPILVRIGVLLRRSAYGLLLYRTSSDQEAYSAPLEKRHFTVELCRASALSGKPGEQRTWMRRIIIPFPQSCRNILATEPFKGSHLNCAAGNSPPPNPEMSFPPRALPGLYWGICQPWSKPESCTLGHGFVESAKLLGAGGSGCTQGVCVGAVACGKVGTAAFGV